MLNWLRCFSRASLTKDSMILHGTNVNFYWSFREHSVVSRDCNPRIRDLRILNCFSIPKSWDCARPNPRISRLEFPVMSDIDCWKARFATNIQAICQSCCCGTCRVKVGLLKLSADLYFTTDSFFFFFISLFFLFSSATFRIRTRWTELNRNQSHVRK